MSNQMNHSESVLTWSDYSFFFLILTYSWSLFLDLLTHFQWTWILWYHFIIVDLSSSCKFLLLSTLNFIYLLSLMMIWHLIIAWFYQLLRELITLWLSILKIVIHSVMQLYVNLSLSRDNKLWERKKCDEKIILIIFDLMKVMCVIIWVCSFCFVCK